mmetsp:Transcript_70721/g.125284  ORF Transcript_70721/g.125284 Transcript_70721/m.125284 type:complete len:207 (+) Transcript_70721:848-1468(+)
MPEAAHTAVILSKCPDASLAFPLTQSGTSCCAFVETVMMSPLAVTCGICASSCRLTLRSCSSSVRSFLSSLSIALCICKRAVSRCSCSSAKAARSSPKTSCSSSSSVPVTLARSLSTGRAMASSCSGTHASSRRTPETGCGSSSGSPLRVSTLPCFKGNGAMQAEVQGNLDSVIGASVRGTTIATPVAISSAWHSTALVHAENTRV